MLREERVWFHTRTPRRGEHRSASHASLSADTSSLAGPGPSPPAIGLQSLHCLYARGPEHPSLLLLLLDREEGGLGPQKLLEQTGSFASEQGPR